MKDHPMNDYSNERPPMLGDHAMKSHPNENKSETRMTASILNKHAGIERTATETG